MNWCVVWRRTKRRTRTAKKVNWFNNGDHELLKEHEDDRMEK